MSKLFSLLFVFLLLIGLASAEADLVYIVKDSDYPETEVMVALDEIGVDYEIIDDSEIASTDFNQYEMILVWDEPLANYKSIPITVKKSLVANSYYLEEWKIAEYAGTSVSTGYLDAQVFQENKITEGVTGVFQVYDKREVIMNFLSYKPKRAPGLERAVVTDNSQKYPVVGYINSGGGLYGGGEANERTAFFGITEADAWTEESKLIFKNTVEWVLYGADNDEDGFFSDEDCDDSDPYINPLGEEIPYNGIDEDCDGNDLRDVDEDGYDSWEVGGEDCDDFDSEINPSSEDMYLNCLNDAPVIEDIEKISVEEGEEVVIEANAWDPELDSLFYSISDSRFIQDENLFMWQTNYTDSGTYYFTVSVDDGEFGSETGVEVEVKEKNQEPVCMEIGAVEWEEEGTGEINISDYCYDPDGDELSFGVYETSSSLNVELESFSEGKAVFSSAEDWWGEDWIVFSVDDGKDKIATNNVTLRVLPINDAPELNKNIENISWEEDTELTDYLNLSEYFSDDGEVNYSVEGNYHVGIQISGEIVSFIPENDWYGSEEIVFIASDGEFKVYSNHLTLTVSNKNEEPELKVNCTRDLVEDTEYACILEAEDEEGDSFEFSVEEEKNLDCEINGNELSYISYPDYNGQAECTLRVSDDYGYSEYLLEVNIAEVNDAPRITPNPYGDVKIVEGNTKLFEVEVEEVDGDEVEIKWELDGEEIGSSKGYLFNKPKGDYKLKVTASDGIEQASYEWDIRVGDISEFTCLEVEGNLCGNDEICYSKDILNVLDTDKCCSVPCQPSLEDIERCENINEDIEITIKDPDEKEEFFTGEIIEVNVKIKNKLDEDIDADIEAYFYDFTEEEVIDDEQDSVSLDEGESEEVEFIFEVKNSLDSDNEFGIFVKAEDEYCNEKIVKIKVEREDEDVVIKDINIQGNMECGGNIDFSVKVINRGGKDQDVVIKAEIPGFGISKESEEFELEKYGEDDSATENFRFSIPEDAFGEHKIVTKIMFNGKSRINEQVISLTCEQKEIQEEIESISLGTKQELIEETQEQQGSKIILGITIATTIVIVLVIIYLLYFIYKFK